MKIFHNFDDKLLESLYQNKISEKNKLPAKRLLIFNIIFHLSLVFLSMMNIKKQILIVSVCNVVLVCLIFLIYFYSKKYKRILLIVFLYGSVLIPFIVLIHFLKFLFEENSFFSSNFDLLFLGISLEMYVSHVYMLEMSWIEISILKILATFYMICYHHIEEGLFKMDYPEVLLVILTFVSFIFDFQKEKDDRKVFFQEYLMKNHFGSFKQILENMPDQILVYQKKGIVFANNSSLLHFKTKDLEEIPKKLRENLNLNNQKIDNLEEKISFSKTECFWDNLNTFFDLEKDTHNFIGDDIIDNVEFDIEIKRIYWENGISLLVLLSKVSEKNMKSRLDLVNSFLTFVLGNISHEINTPLHIIQGKIEAMKNNITNKTQEFIVIQKFLQILNTMSEIMIDLFRIRKGELYLNINKIDVYLALKNVFAVFKECFKYKNIKFQMKNVPKFFNTDLRRMNNILFFILNKLIQRMENGKIEISCFPEIKNVVQFYRLEIFCRGIIKPSETICSLNKNFKEKNFNSPFGSPSNGKQKNDYEFSLIDTLIASISCGNSSKLEIIENKNDLDYKNNDFSFKKCCEENENNIISELKYSFNIYDCELGEQEPIKIKDPFQENQSFLLHFVCSDEKIQNSSKDFMDIHEFSPSLTDNINENKIKLSNKYNSIRILNVDDVLFSLMVITNFCHSQKLPVEEAKNGLEAYNVVQRLYNEENKIFDIIFMDIDMPIMNGFDAAKKINEFLDQKKVKQKSLIFAITANVNNEELLINCVNSGIKEFIKKPLSKNKFDEIIKNYLKNISINIS